MTDYYAQLRELQLRDDIFVDLATQGYLFAAGVELTEDPERAGLMKYADWVYEDTAETLRLFLASLGNTKGLDPYRVGEALYAIRQGYYDVYPDLLDKLDTVGTDIDELSRNYGPTDTWEEDGYLYTRGDESNW